MKTAHVLFMDIVGYSRQSIDDQVSAIHTLKEIVNATPQVVSAQARNQLTSLPTGDGMALVFFSEPIAPVECALAVAAGLKSHPELLLRMGIHSGPVNEIIDVNGNINIAGSGINMAQRVMDSGDAGHILLSKRVAEDLGQYSRWKPLLHDLDEVEVKHAVRVHLFNLFTPDVGNPVTPQRVRKTKTRLILPRIAVAVLVLVAVVAGAVVWMRSRNPGPSHPNKPESHYRALLDRKVSQWQDSIFTAQAANGGFKMSLSADDSSTQVWQTAQCLTAAFAAGRNLDAFRTKIRSGLEYMEKLRRTSPDEGWNLYGNGNVYTVTEIGSWATIANIASLKPGAGIWSETEAERVGAGIIRDMDEILRRQDSSGGWRPIRAENPDFVRTYSTITAMWMLLEAKLSPAISKRAGDRYNESIRRGIQWLLRNYKEGQGLVPNPGRLSQQDAYAGLTAHALFVLSLAESLDEFAYLRRDNSYRTAKLDFLRNNQFRTWQVGANNSHVTDADIRYVNTEYQGEGSTFLWFPWTLLELSRLSDDQNISAEDRKTATELRVDILNLNAANLEGFVEKANLIYIHAENLFCASLYLSAGKQSDSGK